jgi:hypothetical protein
MEEESVHASLWDQFLRDPQGTADELIGALGMAVEADPALTKRLNEFIEEYHRVVAPAGAIKSEPRPDKAPVGGGVPDTTRTAKDEEGREGTYLRRNVPDSSVSLGKGVEGGQPNYGQPGARGLEARRVEELFEQMHETVGDHPEIAPEVKEDLQVRLGEIQTAIEEGGEENIDLLLGHMREVQRSAPDIGEILIIGLTNPELGLGEAMRRAVERLQKST